MGIPLRCTITITRNDQRPFMDQFLIQLLQLIHQMDFLVHTGTLNSLILLMVKEISLMWFMMKTPVHILYLEHRMVSGMK
nr:MAG TPA: hypothetical protein [Caudoviricetes sp.]